MNIIGMANREVLDQIQRGYRMPRHENCPDKIYDYMLRCWDSSPDNRPTFEVMPELRHGMSTVYSLLLALALIL